MYATQIIPPKDLEAVDSIWKVDLDGRRATYGYYYLPDNYSELILVLKGSFQRLVIGTRQKVQMEEGHCYLAPARSKGTILYANADATFLVLKLRPNLHNPIIHTKHFHSRNEVKDVDLSDYIDDDWELAILSANARIVLGRLYEFLEDQYRLSKAADPVVEDCLEVIRDRHGEIKVMDLYDRAGVSKSTLEDRFNKEMGLSPKEFCKIEKINFFLSNYRRFGDNMTLTQLTFKSGYYDQSHLIKEFRYFVDLSPRKYLREVNRLDLRSQPQVVLAMAD